MSLYFYTFILFLHFYTFIFMGPWWKFEASKWIDKWIEKKWDPSALNNQESAVVEFFSESYNPWMPWGWGWQPVDPKIEEEKRKAKLRLQNKIKLAKWITS